MTLLFAFVSNMRRGKKALEQPLDASVSQYYNVVQYTLHAYHI